LANWIKKEHSTFCCLQETHLTDKNKHFLIVKDRCPPKQTRVTILISDKVNFKPKLVRRDKEGHKILIKRVVHQEEIIIVNLYAPNVIYSISLNIYYWT
jgi:hypothetical protein